MLGLATAASVVMAKETPEHRAAISGLMAPYVGWVGLATALNYRVWCVFVLMLLQLAIARFARGSTCFFTVLRLHLIASARRKWRCQQLI